MNLLVKSTSCIILSTTALLAACGGGSTVPTPPVAPITRISAQQAQDATALAGSRAISSIATLKSLGRAAGIKNFSLHYITDDSQSEYDGTPHTYPVGACPGGGGLGSIQVTVLKSNRAVGVRPGDYVNYSFKDCNFGSDIVYNGDIKFTATATTNYNFYLGVNTASNLPTLVSFNNYSETTIEKYSKFNGTVNFISYFPDAANEFKFSVGDVGTSITDILREDVLTSNPSNRIYTRFTNMVSSVDLTTTPLPYRLTTAFALEAYTTNIATPIKFFVAASINTAALTTLPLNGSTYTITKFMNGRIVGTVSNVNTAITIDEGDNGSVDATTTVTNPI